jgi:hypothetical protein
VHRQSARSSGNNSPEHAVADSEFRAPPPGVPEAYTGDAEGQALWEKVVEEEQQTVHPDDLVVDPPPPRVDLSKLPAYAADNLDADGNVN